MSTTTEINHTVLRRPKVEARTGLSRSTIYQLIAEGKFPKPVSIGKRAVGWLESSVNAWIDARVTASNRKGV